MFNLDKFSVGYASVFSAYQNVMYEGRCIAKIHPKTREEIIQPRYNTLPFFIKLQYKTFKRRLNLI